MSKREYFDRYAQSWDELYHQKESQALEALIKRFEITKDNWILDVGTGTGILLPYFIELIGEQGKLFALDFSFKMLSIAKSNFSNVPISFVNSNVEKIPFRNEIFDRVICFATFPHFEDKSKAMQEMSRVLKKGGKLFIAHLLSSEEVKEHHLKAEDEIKNDSLPSTSVMRKMMIEARLKGIKIIDQPSLYLTQGEKG